MAKVLALALFFLPFIVDAKSQLRRSTNVTKHDVSASRNLQAPQNDFLPLLCNAGLASATCRTWSTAFGTGNVHTNRVVIPCGQCITMNHAGTILDLRGGLEIIGKLVIPNKVKINISTTTVIVQGELQMTSSKPVDGKPDIRFTLTGSNDAITFTPIDRNVNACRGVATCSVGKKSIVVAGGQITGTFFQRTQHCGCFNCTFPTNSFSIFFSSWDTVWHSNMDTPV